MVPVGLLSYFIVLGRFFKVPCGFSWFSWFQVDFHGFSWLQVGFSWFQVGFHGISWLQDGLSWFQVGFYGFLFIVPAWFFMVSG